jgi:2,3-dihydroxybiphenyl 1,2-dioxygenase
MVGITNLGYLVIGSNDLDGWAKFATDVVGFQIARHSDTALALRMDKCAYRLLIEKGGEEDVKVAGWQLDTVEALDEYVARVRSHNVEVIKAGTELLKTRGVHALYYCIDPNNLRHEFYVDPTLAVDQDPFVSQVLQSRFLTDRFGLGHFVEVAKNYEETFHFLKNVLGLHVSGYMRPAGTDVTVAFFHTDTGRFHSIATVALPKFPKLCAHIGLEIEDFNDIGRAYDRADKADLLELTMGHHPNAKTTSFYMRTPSDFWIEMGYGEVIIDDADWHIETHAELSAWGHKPAKPDRIPPWAAE